MSGTTNMAELACGVHDWGNARLVALSTMPCKRISGTKKGGPEAALW